jgi:hypothetical protein
MGTYQLFNLGGESRIVGTCASEPWASLVGGAADGVVEQLVQTLPSCAIHQRPEPMLIPPILVDESHTL